MKTMLKRIFICLIVVVILCLGSVYIYREIVDANYESTTRTVDQIQEEMQDKNRFIAHAGGAIDGYIYTNSLEALDLSYKKGFRLFELDILKTVDNVYVAVHGWESWQQNTGFKGTLPPTINDFKKYKVRGKYTSLDLDGINEWFAKHKDAILVTDKVNQPELFVPQFIDKNRLMMELSSLAAIKLAANLKIKSAMAHWGAVKHMKHNIDELVKMGITSIVIDRRHIQRDIEVLHAIRKLGILVYAYGANFEQDKSEKYIVCYDMNHIYGLYLDNFEFNQLLQCNSR